MICRRVYYDLVLRFSVLAFGVKVWHLKDRMGYSYENSHTMCYYNNYYIYCSITIEIEGGLISDSLTGFLPCEVVKGKKNRMQKSFKYSSTSVFHWHHYEKPLKCISERELFSHCSFLSISCQLWHMWYKRNSFFVAGYTTNCVLHVWRKEYMLSC